VPYLHASAKTGVNVHDALVTLLRRGFAATTEVMPSPRQLPASLKRALSYSEPSRTTDGRDTEDEHAGGMAASDIDDTATEETGDDEAAYMYETDEGVPTDNETEDENQVSRSDSPQADSHRISHSESPRGDSHRGPDTDAPDVAAAIPSPPPLPSIPATDICSEYQRVTMDDLSARFLEGLVWKLIKYAAIPSSPSLVLVTDHLAHPHWFDS